LGDTLLLLRLVGFELALAVPVPVPTVVPVRALGLLILLQAFAVSLRRSSCWCVLSCCPCFSLKIAGGSHVLRTAITRRSEKAASSDLLFVFFHCHFRCYCIRGGAADRLVGVRLRRRKKPWGRSELFHFHRRLFRYDLISFLLLLLLLLLRERRDFAGAELLLWM